MISLRSPVVIVLVLLSLHFLADFVFQSHWMASNKSKRWDALFLHTAIYAGSFNAFLAVWPLGTVNKFVIITFVAHTLTDAVTSRLTSQLWSWALPSRQQMGWTGVDGTGVQLAVPETVLVPHEDTGAVVHNFFVVIGFDQLLHVYQLVGTAWLLGLLGGGVK